MSASPWDRPSARGDRFSYSRAEKWGPAIVFSSVDRNPGRTNHVGTVRGIGREEPLILRAAADYLDLAGGKALAYAGSCKDGVRFAVQAQ